MGAVSHPQGLREEFSPHQILMPNHEASFDDSTANQFFPRRSLKKSQTTNFGNLFVHFFKGVNKHRSLNYHGNHHYKKQHLTHIVLMSEASNALEFAVVASKLQCLLTVDHIEKPSLS